MNNIITKTVFSILFSCLLITATAQITGKVTDSHKKTSVPFANAIAINIAD